MYPKEIEKYLLKVQKPGRYVGGELGAVIKDKHDVDVRFAHNAGVKVCGVSWGFRGAEELRTAGADMIVNSAEELYKAVKQ